MFKIKSFNTTLPPKISLEQAFEQLCNKSDYQLQCGLDYFSLTHKSEAKFRVSKTKNMRKVAEKRQGYKQLNYMFVKDDINRWRGKQNIESSRINIKNVEQIEQKKIKCLQSIILNKKSMSSLLPVIKDEAITFNVASRDIDEKKSLDISMEIMFGYYMEYYLDKLKKATLEGSVKGKIIIPFLVMCKKIKKDQNSICLTPEISVKNNRRWISKSQIFKVFKLYQPKLSLQKEMQQAKQNDNNIYEKEYKKYDNLPFSQKLPKIEAIVEETQEQNNSQGRKTKKNVIFKIQEQLQQKIENISPNSSTKNTENRQKSRKVDNDRQNFEKQIQLENIRSSNTRQSQIKERFEDRFKRQLKQLSDDASNIMRTRNNQ